MKCSFYEEGLRAIAINFPRTKRIPRQLNKCLSAETLTWKLIIDSSFVLMEQGRIYARVLSIMVPVVTKLIFTSM